VTESPTSPLPSDRVEAITSTGRNAVAMAILSMSARSEEGRDAEYLEWHMLDHLPEQHRLSTIRSGQRWVSTPACRAARAASEPPFDEVDHIVQYLFAEPLTEGLGGFFDLGAALHGAGRMPIALPRRHLAAYQPVARWSAPNRLVGADVLPWRPLTGVYVVVEPSAERAERALGSDVDGVVGAWRLHGLDGRHPRLDDAAAIDVTVWYLDGDPVAVGRALADEHTSRWRQERVEPLLAAAFHEVVPWRWDRALPTRDVPNQDEKDEQVR
jgi:hypothetical protein